MGSRLLGTGISLALLAVACTPPEEDTAPVFQVTSPTLATTSTAVPSTLEYIGLPELSGEENAMCRFIQSVGRDLAASDDLSRSATTRVEAAVKDRTLSEPLRVRALRDTELANAQRFANVLKRFEEATSLVTMIQPGPLTDQGRLDQDAQDAALLASIGESIQNTIDTLRPLNAAEQEAFKEDTGSEWKDLFTETEYDEVLTNLYNDSTGLGREMEARDAMERLDDWSWRHCSAGLTE